MKSKTWNNLPHTLYNTCPRVFLRNCRQVQGGRQWRSLLYDWLLRPSSLSLYAYYVKETMLWQVFENIGSCCRTHCKVWPWLRAGRLSWSNLEKEVEANLAWRLLLSIKLTRVLVRYVHVDRPHTYTDIKIFLNFYILVWAWGLISFSHITLASIIAKMFYGLWGMNMNIKTLHTKWLSVGINICMSKQLLNHFFQITTSI